MVWFIIFLFMLVGCTQPVSNEETTIVEATRPVATAVPAEPTVTATEPAAEDESEAETLDAFVEQLQTAVVDQDFATMEALMSDPIAVAGWRSEGRMYTPAQAVSEFQNNSLPAPTVVQFTGLTEDELNSLLGQPPASLFGPTATIVTALHSSGWGLAGTDEAILFVAEDDGRYVWYAFLYTFGSFSQNGVDNNTAEDESGGIPFVETDTDYVTAQQDVTMYSGPGESYDEIGNIFDGQTALVTGQSEDGNWWRVICPDDTVGDCWVTADPAYTQPTDGPAGLTSLITDNPIFTGGDLEFKGWSPDGRYLAYFEYTEEQVAQEVTTGLRGTYPGTFVFYDTQTGEKCTDYPYSGLFPTEGGGNGAQWHWLPNGQLLLSLPDGQLLQTDAPCVTGNDIASLFPERIIALVRFSPDNQWLILVGESQYFLYDWANQSTLPIAEVQPDSFNNLVWSPDSQHISITLAGNYTGDRSPLGGTRLIDAATGEIIARHDWEPANALDGTFGGPVWINNEEFVVTLSLDQGPFLMNIAGEVEPLLPLLFDETFDPDNYWPPLDVYAEVENGRYAILRSNEGRDTVAKLYTVTPDGESLELLEPTAFAFYLFPNGMVGYYEENDGRYWLRPIFDMAEAFSEQPAGVNPYQSSAANDLLVTADATSISVYDRAGENLIARLQIAGYEDGYQLYPILSPDDQWLAIFVREPRYGLGKALFVILAPSD